jgi:hypothetical protein
MDDMISRQLAIDKFIDELDEIFADLRERHVDDSVCGLCEYDGAYIGQSGDWCNECPGFEKDDCFKLSGKIRKEWTDEIIKALPSAQPERQWIPCSERLPDKTDDYLCSYNGCAVVDICEYDPDRKEWGFFYDGGWKVVSNVIAWMPLPEPWKGE